MLFDDNSLKRYYTISEVAELFDVSKSLIRFWDTEFDLLKPHKNSKGERRFTRENLEQFQLIYHLVKERGFTLAGAKQEIQQNKDRLREKMDIIRRLRKVRIGMEKLQVEMTAEEEE
ncbi:MAG TPA: MerR family transcriptional regulator [Saprospiraceae bacterium]|nr:MerR family transcriptional regulator [Saprospiraceae bacterium]